MPKSKPAVPRKRRNVGVTRILEDNPGSGQRRAGRRYLWNTREIAVLRDHFPIVGVPGCLRLLPGRSAVGIYAKANLLKLPAPVTVARAEKGITTRQKWQATAEIDDILRERIPTATKRRDIVKLANELDRPRWWVSKRAALLGLVSPRFKEPDWTQPERDYIRENAHKNPEVVSRGLRRMSHTRSATSIVVQLKRMEISQIDPNHFTATGFSRLMGTDASTVSGWCENGLIAAKRRGTKRVAAQGGDQWWFSRRDARSFVINHADVIDIRKVEKVMFIKLLAGKPLD